MFRRKGENLNRKGFICFVLKRENKKWRLGLSKAELQKNQELCRYGFVYSYMFVYIYRYTELQSYARLFKLSRLYGRNIGSFKDLPIVIIITYLDITKINVKSVHTQRYVIFVICVYVGTYIVHILHTLYSMSSLISHKIQYLYHNLYKVPGSIISIHRFQKVGRYSVFFIFLVLN